MGGHVTPGQSQEGARTILDAATATGAGSVYGLLGIWSTFHAVANGTSGAFSATVDIEVSNDGTNWITMGTITLSGTATTADDDGFASNAAWKSVRANVTAISGTGANVTVTMGG